MLTSSSCSPVARSTPVIMAPSMSFLPSAASAFLRRSATISSTIAFMNATSFARSRLRLRNQSPSSGRPRVNMMVSSERTSDSIKRVETVIESTQPDGVERQRRHVMNNINLLISIQAFPLLDELLGDIDHARVVGLHSTVAERLHQDVVRLAPVRLV